MKPQGKWSGLFLLVSILIICGTPELILAELAATNRETKTLLMSAPNSRLNREMFSGSPNVALVRKPRKAGECSRVDHPRICDRLFRIISEQLDIHEQDIHLHSSVVNDLGADSLSVVELVLAIEEEFSMDISDKECYGLSTVSDYFEMIKRKGY